MTGARARAYAAARYCVRDGDDDIAIRIGKPSLDADALLVRHGVAEGILITAWNPGSVACSSDRNEQAGRELEAALDAAAIRHLPHSSSAEDGAWLEQGFLALGLGVAAGLALAARFGQAAIVHLQAGQPARLLFTPG